MLQKHKFGKKSTEWQDVHCSICKTVGCGNTCWPVEFASHCETCSKEKSRKTIDLTLPRREKQRGKNRKMKNQTLNGTRKSNGQFAPGNPTRFQPIVKKTHPIPTATRLVIQDGQLPYAAMKARYSYKGNGIELNPPLPQTTAWAIVASVALGAICFLGWLMSNVNV